MKTRLLAALALAGGAAAMVFRRTRQQQAERDLWREATDDVEGISKPVG